MRQLLYQATALSHRDHKAGSPERFGRKSYVANRGSACAYPADPARGLHYCTLARNERLYPPVFHQLQRLSANWQIKLIAPPPAEGIDMFPADIAEYVPVDLHGPGVLYPWRFDQTELRAIVKAAILKHSPDRALVWCGAEGI